MDTVLPALPDSYAQAVKERAVAPFRFNCDGARSGGGLPWPSLLGWNDSARRGQPGTSIQIKRLMISCLTWDGLQVPKWCEGGRARPTYFLFAYSDGRGKRLTMTTCWSAPVTCIYCSNAEGKRGVKLNGVLAVSTFSLEAWRMGADGERRPGSSNRQDKPVSVLGPMSHRHFSHLVFRKVYMHVRS